MQVLTLRKVATIWADKTVQALGEDGSKVAACHESKAAKILLNETIISVKKWDQYPGPPDSFLDHEWECSSMDAVKQPVVGLRWDDPVPLTETEAMSRIIRPALVGSKNIFPEVFGFTVEGNLVIQREVKTESNTSPDLTLWKGKLVGGVWVRDGRYKSFVEGKPPLAADDSRVNDKLTDSCGKTVEEYRKTASVGAAMILSQVSFSDSLNKPY